MLYSLKKKLEAIEDLTSRNIARRSHNKSKLEMPLVFLTSRRDASKSSEGSEEELKLTIIDEID